MKKLHVLGFRVLLEEIPCVQEVDGIVLPDSASQKPTKFKVVDVGDDVLEVKINDIVLIDVYTGTEIIQENIKYRIVEEDEILALVNEE